MDIEGIKQRAERYAKDRQIGMDTGFSRPVDSYRKHYVEDVLTLVEEVKRLRGEEEELKHQRKELLEKNQRMLGKLSALEAE